MIVITTTLINFIIIIIIIRATKFLTIIKLAESLTLKLEILDSKSIQIYHPV